MNYTCSSCGRVGQPKIRKGKEPQCPSCGKYSQNIKDVIAEFRSNINSDNKNK